MLLSKPAGCALQAIGLPMLLLGLSNLYFAIRPGLQEERSPLIGIALIVLGSAALLLGLKPGQQAARVLEAAAADAARPKRKCPSCAETVLAEAKKCRFCGQDLAPEQR